MVDREARVRYAALIRRLACGAMVTDVFQAEGDQLVDSTEDSALKTLHKAVDCCYHDIWPYRLRGRNRLDAEERRVLARCVLYLRSDTSAVGESPDVPPGPLGLVDIPLALLVIVLFIVGIATAGVAGVVGGSAVLVGWLWWVHVRQIRHQTGIRRVWQTEAIWPFPDERSYRHACSLPVFLTGSVRSCS